MCFRPAMRCERRLNKCPECGKTIQMMAGVTLKACPFCKADFTPYINGEKPLPNAAPGAPRPPQLRRPKAPAAPALPSLPPRKRTRCFKRRLQRGRAPATTEGGGPQHEDLHEVSRDDKRRDASTETRVRV